jgi:hypothetical protein
MVYISRLFITLTIALMLFGCAEEKTAAEKLEDTMKAIKDNKVNKQPDSFVLTCPSNIANDEELFVFWNKKDGTVGNFFPRENPELYPYKACPISDIYDSHYYFRCHDTLPGRLGSYRVDRKTLEVYVSWSWTVDYSSAGSTRWENCEVADFEKTEKILKKLRKAEDDYFDELRSKKEVIPNKI